jgi:hypothetical protein
VNILYLGSTFKRSEREKREKREKTEVKEVSGNGLKDVENPTLTHLVAIRTKSCLWYIEQSAFAV